MNRNVDVVILGGGLAGLSLARQLTLTSNKSILLLEKRSEIPPPRQKVGEATVQLSGYYFSKVLDLEEHLMRKHLMKYNLRFYWKTPGRPNDSYEDYSQSYIRDLSNIASYQLDRNKIERELLRLNLESTDFTLHTAVTNLSVSLSECGPHQIRYTSGGITYTAGASWVVDTTGRSKFLSRQLALKKKNPIRHGASFFWVEGLVNIEKLTSLTAQESRVHKHRCMTGHLPVWLATNHFVGEGFWFWVIPLHGKTSLGLVYDREKVPGTLVSTPAKLIDWIRHEFPLFARQFEAAKVVDHSLIADFSYDCQQTISEARWALAGEAGRFTDPLYSPGGDLISLYNTLITDCIHTTDPQILKTKTRLYEVMMQAFYQAYVPSYAVSYEVLGDQECFAMKYSWELAVYFTFFVFPFINDLFIKMEFSGPFLREFAKLGDINRSLQEFITSYYRWKKNNCSSPCRPQFFDFTELRPLQSAAELFYKVGLNPEDGLDSLRRGFCNLKELARYILAHICSVVSGDPSLVSNRSFIESLDLKEAEFKTDFIRKQAEAHSAESGPSYRWDFDPYCLTRLQVAANMEMPGKFTVLQEPINAAFLARRST